MAGKYDSIRNRHKQQGEDAKARVLARTYGGGTATQEQPQASRFDAIRNRTSNLSVGDTTRTNATYESKMNANEQRMGNGDPTAIARPSESVSARTMHERQQEQVGSVPSVLQLPASNHDLPTITNKSANVQKVFDAPKKTIKGQLNVPTLSYPQNVPTKQEWIAQEAAARDKQLGGAPNFIKAPLQAIGKGIDYVQAYTPGLADFQQGAGNTLGVQAQTAPTTGGTLGKITKGVGMLAAGAVNPASLEQSAVTGAGRVTTGIMQKYAPKASPFVQRLAGNTAEGALQGAANTVASGRTSLKDVVEGAALGGLGGAAFEAAGTGIGKVLKGTGKTKIPVEPGPPKAAEPTVATAKDNWFNRLFGSSNLGIKAGSQATRSGTGMQIVNNPLKNDTQGVINHTKEIGRAIKNDYVDLTDSLKHLGGDVQDVAYDARRANNLANTWVHDVGVTPEGEVVGNSLKDVVGAVPRGQGNAFDDYLVVRHAPYRVARGEMVYAPELEMNDVAKLEARRAQLEARHPDFKRLGDEYDKFNGNLLDLGQNFGLISEKQKTAMRTENPHYAPNRRQFSTSERYSQFIGAKKGYSGQKAPIKDVSPTGSARKIVSPVRTTIEATGAWMNAGMRNRVMQAVLNQVELDPKSMEGIIEVIPEHMRGDSLKEINNALQDGGFEGLTELLDNEFNAVFAKSKVGKTDNIVTAMVDGNPVKMRVLNPEIFRALQGTSPQDVGIVMGTFRMLSNATKHGATGTLAPLFAAKGATTDIATALIQSKHTRYHLVDLVHAVFSSIANKAPKGTPGVKALRSLAQDFKRTGGEYSAGLRGDRALNRSVGALRREPLLSPKGIAKGTWTAVKFPFKFLGGISDISENVNRIAAYKGEMRRSGHVRTPENVRRAMRESQEITTNFSKKGAKSDNIEAFIPYSNAAVQSIRRFGTQWAKHPVKTTVMVTTLIILPKLWEAAKFGNDPEYQNLPARTRYRNLIVHKNDDGTFVQLPMPPEYEAIGGVLGDALTKYRDGNPVKWGDAADALMNAYTPPFVSGAAQGATQGGGVDQSVVGALNSTVIGPIAGYAHNQSWTGAPIVPQRLQGNSPYMQKDERTSSVASWISSTGVGKKLGLSPIKLDYLAKQYGGDIARLGLPLMTDMGSGTKVQSLLRNFIVDPTFTNNLSRDYYNRIQKVTQNIADVGDGAKSPAWLTDEVKKLATSRAKGSPLKQLTDLGAEKRSIQGNKLLSTSEKALQLRENQRKINNIYLEVVSQLEKLGVPK